ncbi:MAG: tetratricopeptide repeat protein [Thermodesulfobacteriota bacterium]
MARPTNIKKLAGPVFLALISSAAFLLALAATNWSWQDLFLTPDQQGSLLLKNEEYDAAAQRFSDPRRRGTALYRAGDFKEAAAAFGRDNSPEGLFNRGNALLMAGKYGAAIKSYEQALAQEPQWRGARDNLEIARARKEKMKGPDDDAGGTGGKLAADEVVYDKRAQQNSSQNKESVTGGAEISDEEMRALWLRRVQTRPADFLRAKFAQQAARKGQESQR